MARVEWSVLEGGQVETLLANLIYNLDGRSLRIRPSQGDYGIDVIRPSEADPARWDIYQIKKFAQNLTAGQKGQIIKSFASAMIGMLRKDVPLADWYLVLPLDPTLENYLEWLTTVPDEAIKKLKANRKLKITSEELDRIDEWRNTPGRVIGWKGLDFCEDLAAKYQYVVDYFVFGGNDRMRGAMDSLVDLLQLDRSLKDAQPGEGEAALLHPGEIKDRLVSLSAALDTDPHYRYGISFGPVEPEFRPEPMLAAATYERLSDGQWLTFKIYARSAQSTEERPIPLTLKFEFEPDSREERAFKDWLKFGRPFEGVGSANSSLPGGLGRETGSGSGKITLSQPPQDVPTYIGRQRVVSPDGEVLAEVRLTLRASAGVQGNGVRSYGTDESGWLETESLWDQDSNNVTLNYRQQPLVGQMATRVLEAVTFTRHLHAPNTVQIGGEVGPFTSHMEMTNADPLINTELADMIADLATIQTRTARPVLIPDFDGWTWDDIRGVKRAASLIRGQTVVSRWNQVIIERHADAQVNVGDKFEVINGQYLRLRKITGDDVLGFVQQHSQSVIAERVDGLNVHCVPYKNDTETSRLVEALPDAPEGKAAVFVNPIID